MKENLLFGADITSYGAKGDGKTDCHDAFQSALDKKENLITVPYGVYVIKGQLRIGSNVKLDLHPKAVMLFDCDENILVTNKEHKKGNSGIIINGGIWKAKNARKDKKSDMFFSFENIKNLKITNAAILPCHRNAISLFKAEDFRINTCLFDTSDCANAGDCVRLEGQCKDGIIKNLEFSGNDKQDRNTALIAFDTDEKCKISDNISSSGKITSILIENLSARKIYSFIRLFCHGSEVCGIEIDGIRGSFLHSVLDLSKSADSESNGKFADICMGNISALCEKSSENSGYFLLEGRFDGLEIQNFSRDRDSEAFPFIPTLIMHNTSPMQVITDGMALDEIISAKGKSRLSSMTAAKISTPTGKYVYTFEAGLSSEDELIIPSGNFDYLQADIIE